MNNGEGNLLLHPMGWFGAHTHGHTHTPTCRNTSVIDLSNSEEQSSSNLCHIICKHTCRDALWSIIIPEYGANHCSQYQSSPTDSTQIVFNYTLLTFGQLNILLPSSFMCRETYQTQGLTTSSWCRTLWNICQSAYILYLDVKHICGR